MPVNYCYMLRPAPPVASDELHEVGKVAFKGHIEHSTDISAVMLLGEFLVIGADEGNVVQVLKQEGGHFRVTRTVPLNDTGKEIDIEGITGEGDTVYVIGSHSWKRRKLDE